MVYYHVLGKSTPYYTEPTISSFYKEDEMKKCVAQILAFTAILRNFLLMVGVGIKKYAAWFLAALLILWNLPLTGNAWYVVAASMLVGVWGWFLWPHISKLITKQSRTHKKRFWTKSRRASTIQLGVTIAVIIAIYFIGDRFLPNSRYLRIFIVLGTATDFYCYYLAHCTEQDNVPNSAEFHFAGAVKGYYHLNIFIWVIILVVIAGGEYLIGSILRQI